MCIRDSIETDHMPMVVLNSLVFETGAFMDCFEKVIPSEFLFLSEAKCAIAGNCSKSAITHSGELLDFSPQCDRNCYLP